MQAHGHVSWLVEMDIKDGRLADAEQLMNDMIEHTEQEPTTHTYDWYVSDDKTKAAIYERYDDTMVCHEHLKGFLATFVDRFVDVFDATRLTVFGSPHEDLKADLAGWGPTYLEYWGGFRR